jgi:dystonin
LIFFRCLVQVLKQSVADEKPAVDLLTKTGLALAKLVGEDDAEKIREIIDDMAARFDVVKNVVRQKSNALDEALQQTLQVRFTS